MNPRGQGWGALVVAGLALVIGLVASRGDDDASPGEALRRYAATEAQRRRVADPSAGTTVEIDQPDDDDDPPSGALVIHVEPGSVRVDGAELTDRDLAARARDLAIDDPDAAVVLQADPDVGYERIVELMELVKAAGLSRIALSAQPR